MITCLEVGKPIEEGETSYSEGGKFDINDTGGILMIYFNDPTEQEIYAVQEGRIKFGYYTENGVIFTLFKIGDMEWMDLPYTVHLSDQLTHLEEYQDGEGMLIAILLIDAKTGILKVIRAFSLPTMMSRNLEKEMKKQAEIPFEENDYLNKINEVYKKYSIKDFVKYSSYKCTI